MKTSSPALPPSSDPRGQSLVELALSLMVILMLLMGSVQFGTALFAYVSLRDAAQEGAVYGSVNPADQAGIKNRAADSGSDIVVIDPEKIVITYSNPAKVCEGATDGQPHTLKVQIEHNFPIFMPLVAPMIGADTITLRAQVTNTILYPICR